MSNHRRRSCRKMMMTVDTSRLVLGKNDLHLLAYIAKTLERLAKMIRRVCRSGKL